MLRYKNKIPVAAHRGNSAFYPENTMAAFRSAAALGVDMVETDVQMTRDGELVLIHDDYVDRTTDGHGRIYDMTLEEVRRLDAGSHKGEEFRGEKIPTFIEFLEFFKDYPDMLFNIELKVYPEEMGDFALVAMRKTIELMDKYKITERSVVNSWSGELNEIVYKTYGKRIKIHAYPAEIMMGRQDMLVHNYAYCICYFGDEISPVTPKFNFDFCHKMNVEPWAYFNPNDPRLYELAIERGAVLFTANDPKWVMELLREKGLHD